MRLRGPWLITGAHLDTVVTLQSGTIPTGGTVTLAMSPYTFFPDITYSGAPANAFLIVRPRSGGPPDADNPTILLWHGGAMAAPYSARWRHVNP